MLLGGCGDDGGTGTAEVPRADFEQAVAERFRASEDQATCIADYVYAEYEPVDIDLIYRDGIGAVPQRNWDPWFHAAVACLTLDRP